MSDETMRLVPDDVLERLDDMMCHFKADGSVLLSESVANEHGEDLQALLNAYRALSTRDEVGPVAGDDPKAKVELVLIAYRNRMVTLEAAADQVLAAIAPPVPQDDALRIADEEFCRRVEAGEIRSKRSYAAFKAALKSTAGQEGGAK